MKRFFILAAALLLGTSLGAQVPEALNLKTFKLSNGMEVWISEDHSQPKVGGAVVVRAGAADCPNSGIAHYFEHIMFKGTDSIGTVDYKAEKQWLDSISMAYDSLAATKDRVKRDSIQKKINTLSISAAKYAIPNEYDRLISHFGGSQLNASTSYDMTEFHNAFPGQYLREWAELNSERMINPVYRLFQGELETVYEEKNMYSDDLLQSAMERVTGKFFEGTPYEYPIIGSTENLKNPQQSKMDEFYDRYYVAGNMTLVLCGDVDAGEALPILEQTFGRIKSGNAPERAAMEFSTPDPSKTIEIKVPLPIIKIGLRMYRVPGFSDPDMPLLQLATSLLNNGNATGLLDELRNNNKVMAVACSADGLRDGGMMIMMAIPNIPAGSVGKAMKLADGQIAKLCKGDFPESLLEAAKAEALRNTWLSLESIDSRTQAMIILAGMGKGLSWEEYLGRQQALADVTKEDIVRIANKYFGQPYMAFEKKMGSYPKDRITQPGYEPIVPENAGKESAYAENIKASSGTRLEPRMVDFEKDLTTIGLEPLKTLYTVNNPIDDLFRLDLIFHKGSNDERMLSETVSVLSESGTDSLSYAEFQKSLQALGATMALSSETDNMTVSLIGYDSSFPEAVALLKHFLGHAKADRARIKELRQNFKLDMEALEKDNTTLAMAALYKLIYGDKSEYINRLNYKETKALKPSELEACFKRVQETECSIVYSGRLDDSAVASVVASLASPTEPHGLLTRTFLPAEAPAVYFVECPAVRQNAIITYTQLPPAPTASERSAAMIWGNYFGSDMSSVLFQEIREMRAMAYATQGQLMAHNFDTKPSSPMGFMTYLGTQADKTMGALAVLDSAFTAMPVRKGNLIAARQSLLNGINNNYPSFRDLGPYVVDSRIRGCKRDGPAFFVESQGSVSDEDVLRYYRENVKDAPRILIIVGDRRNVDLRALSEYGPVKELKLSDLVRK